MARHTRKRPSASSGRIAGLARELEAVRGAVGGVHRELDAVEYLVHVTAAALLRALEAGKRGKLNGLPPFLEALRGGLAPFMASIPGVPFRRGVTRPPVPGVRSGKCALCGCTDGRACPGGCAWANADRTICTRCEAELEELRGRQAPGARQGGRARPTTKGSRLHELAAPGAARPARPHATGPAPSAGDVEAAARLGHWEAGAELRAGQAPSRSPARPVAAPDARPAGKGASRPGHTERRGPSSIAGQAPAGSAVRRKAPGARQGGPARPTTKGTPARRVAAPGRARPAGQASRRPAAKGRRP